MVQLTRRRLTLMRRREETGAVAVVVALMMVVLIMCAAVVVDLGNAKDVRRQSQNASDSAALAGVNALYPDSNSCASGPVTPPCFTAAVAAVKAFSINNFQTSAADWTGCSATVAQRLTYTPAGESTCISFDSATSPKTLRVLLPARTINTFFGGITGNSTIRVGSQADAGVTIKIKCTLCFLGGVDARNADFDVTGGSIAVNGNVDAGPNSNWTSLVNGVVGTVNGGVFNPAPTPIQPFGDPLAGALTLPIDLSALPLKTDPCTQGPGRYNGTINIPNNATCNLTPGFYGITGTWQLGNNSLLKGSGVTLYAQAPNGYLDFKNGNVDLSPPTSGTYKGYTVIYDRNNTNDLSLQGNGLTGISGITYAPSARLDFNGNSCFVFDGGPVVVAGVNLANGNQSCVKITNPADTEIQRTPLHLVR
jgi:hypothetical protein